MWTKTSISRPIKSQLWAMQPRHQSKILQLQTKNAFKFVLFIPNWDSYNVTFTGIGRCLPNWHMMMSTVEHHDGQWQCLKLRKFVPLSVVLMQQLSISSPLQSLLFHTVAITWISNCLTLQRKLYCSKKIKGTLNHHRLTPSLWINFTCFCANESDSCNEEAKTNTTPKKRLALHVVATDNCSLLILPDSLVTTTTFEVVPVAQSGCTGSPAPPEWHIHTCGHKKVCFVPQRRYQETSPVLDRAIEGHQPSSRTGICSFVQRQTGGELPKPYKITSGRLLVCMFSD